MPGKHGQKWERSEDWMINLREIDFDNFWEIIDLSVDENQSDYVTSNAVSIAQSKVQPECIPLAVYDGDTPVGFAMYCIDRDDGEYWLYRLMTDKKYQGKGFAKAAVNLILERVMEDKSRHKMFLGVHRESIAAVKLYESLGFRFNGRIFGKEHIMVLDFSGFRQPDMAEI
jgi:diamine N-acetyltransferase